MTPDQYILQVLGKYAVAIGSYSPAEVNASALAPVIGNWAEQWLARLSFSGSYVKGTAVKGATNIDPFISLKSGTLGTLSDIYKSLFQLASNSMWLPCRQNVSIGINYIGAKIDLVHGRVQEGYRNIQSNIDLQIEKLWHITKLPTNNEQFTKIKLLRTSYLNSTWNWYAVAVGKLPLHQAIVVCQRSNCRWDSKLRQRYNEWIRAILIITIAATIFLGVYQKRSFSDLLLSVFAPISPAILWTIREYKKQKETCNTLDKLKNHAETLLEKAKKSTLSPDEIKIEARFLQDELYDHRRNCPLIFDWVYNRLRNEQEEQMNKSVEKLVEDFLQN